MKIWLIIIASSILTFGLRFSFIKLFENWNVPVFVQRALRFVPAAALSALVFPKFIYTNRILNIAIDNDRLIAGFLAAFVAYRTKNVLWTLGVGMGVMWLLGLV